MNIQKITKVFMNADGGAAGAAGAAAGQAGGADPAAGAAAGAGAAQGAGTQTPGQAAGGSDWMTGLSPEAKGYVENKAWKTPADILSGYQNLEKLRGVPAERLLTLPSDPADKAAWDQFYGRLGRPAKPEEYKIPMPEKGRSPEFEKFARGAFHELGLTAKQAEDLAGKWNEFAGGQVKAQSEAYGAQVQEQAQNLKKEWGAAYDKNVEAAQTAAKNFGIDKDTISKMEQAMGYSNVIKLFQKIGEGLGEGRFVSGGKSSAPGVLTPGQAMAKISELRSDREWSQAYLSGDKAKVSEMSRLLQMANPDEAQG